MVKGGINSSTPTSNDTVNVRVSVTDTDGNPIENAIVTLTNRTSGDEFTGRTGSAGGCTINVQSGGYTVETEASGYVNDLDDITVTDVNSSLNISLIKE